MAIDYDVPRTAEEDEDTKTVSAIKGRSSPAASELLDIDDADDAVGVQLPRMDLSGLDLEVVILPVQADEFTCVSCFLVKHRSQFDSEGKLGPICRECAA